MRERISAARSLAICFMMAIMLAAVSLPGKVFAATPITAGCSGVKRTSAGNATAWVYSDTAGTIYYVVDEDKTYSSGAAAIVSAGNNGGTVAAGNIGKVTLSKDMYTGKKYAHMVVVDSNSSDNISNVITIEMPYDCMYSESFEGYPENYAASGAGFGFATNQTVISEGSNKICKLYGGPSGNEQNIEISNGNTFENVTMIFETRIKAGSSSPSAEFALLSYDNYYGRRLVAGVKMENGTWKAARYNYKDNDGYSESVELDLSEAVSVNKWYTVRIVYDSPEKQFDVYIDGKKANSNPISILNRYGINRIKIYSAAGQTMYYDDLLYNSYVYDNDARVNFSLEEAKYVNLQSVKLSTELSGRTIYYTTDGSYPNPISTGSGSTKLYTGAINIGYDTDDDGDGDHITTIRAVAGTGTGDSFKAEGIAYSKTYTFVKAPVLYGNSIYRENDKTATAWLRGDIAGTIYYLPSAEKLTDIEPEVIEEAGNEKAVKADEINAVSLSAGMNARIKYVYFVLKDAENNYSNIVEEEIPFVKYFHEGFDVYPEGLSSGYYSFNSGNAYSDKVTPVIVDSGIAGEKTTAIQFAATTGDRYANRSFGGVSGGIITLEAKVRSEDDSANFEVGFGQSGKIVGIKLVNGIWNVTHNSTDEVADQELAGTFRKDTWYNIKLSVDCTNKECTAYINGKNIGTYAHDYGVNYIDLNYYANSQTVYFDDVTYYVEEKTVTPPTANRGLIYTGSAQTGVKNYNDTAAEYYLESGTIEETMAGSYTAVFALNNSSYRWSDGTQGKKTVSWSIGRKPVTVALSASKVYDGTDDAEIAVDTAVGSNGITGIIDADLEDTEKSISITPASATGYYENRYVGTGKSITLESADAFTLTGAGSENYTLTEPVIAGDITAAAQTLAIARTLQAGVGDIITDNQLRTAVKGAKGVLSFAVADGGEYAEYTSGTGLVINDNANGHTIKVKATAAAGDLNEDGIPEYDADETGVIFDVEVSSKETQTLIFARPSLSIVYGRTGEGQTAELIVDEGETGGAVTYSIDDPAEASVAVVDKNTGTITTAGTGTATVTATAAATAKYNQATASYTITITEAPQAAPSVGKKDESVAGNKDGALTGITTDMEYRMEGEAVYTDITAAMLSEGNLTGLAAGTYYVRLKAKPNYNASQDTKVVIALGGADEKLSFAKSELTAVYGDTGVGQKASSSVSDGGAITYSSDNTDVAEVNPSTGDVTIKGTGTATITAKSAATAIYSGTSVSYKLTINKASQKAPGATVKPESVEGQNDGSITGLTSEMEYRKHGETAYTPVNGDSITGLEPGTYYIRVKANNNYEASADTTVVVAAGKEEDISASITYAENIPLETKEATIKKTNTDSKDIEGSTQKYLMPKATVKKQTIKVSWNKIAGADGYIVYGNLCGKKLERVAEITNGSTKAWTAKKLKKGKYYKYVVVAYKTVSSGKQKVITTSRTVHAVTDGGKKGNPTGLTVKKSKLTVKVGKKQTIKAGIKYKKKVATHVAKLRFESNDTTIATVGYKNGVVKGVKKGKTFIYVYTQNGICKKVTVTVK